jgi:signal transduction histidine kinase
VVAALHRASREFARSAPGRIVVTGSAPVLAADPHRLGQALRNLLDNALRYGSGSVRLAVTENADTVEVHVTDEGRGFPAGYLAHAFERFTRADAGRSGRGAGLGLAIVDAVARAHGGTAHAANRAAGGADVWLVLPAGQDRRSRGTGGTVTRAGSTSRRSAQASNPATSTSYGGSSA